MKNQKTAIVTGSNKGIGKEIVKQLIEQGFSVIATGRNLDKVKELTNSIGQNAIPFEVDVAINSSCENFARYLKSKFEKIDVLINNAGIIGKSSISNFNMEEIENVMNTNFFGALRLTKAVLPLLKKSDNARIINISSGMGELSGMNGSSAAYRLSKWALNGFTIMLAEDLKINNIKVNAICPGWCRTDMGGIEAPRNAAKGAETAVWLATEKNIPNGKFLRDKKIIAW
jgi:NAD(P)-dependent dehydrogenase (short-subunit alcohol dehydrogenase family)